MNHEEFFNGYLSALLSSLGEQASYLTFNEINPTTLRKMQRDCREFCLAAKTPLGESHLKEERAGSLFWVNRNKGNIIFSDENARTSAQHRALVACTQASYHFGPVGIYIQSGQIYCR